MSDGGYWIDSPDNPFNQMSYTRGGGGYDNSSTHESNAARAFAMQGSGTGALSRYADTATAQSVLPAGSLAVVGDYVIRTTAQTPAGGGSGAGAASAQVGTAAPGAGGSGPGVAIATTGGKGGKGSGSRLVITVPGNANRKSKGEQVWPQDPDKGPGKSFDGVDDFIPMDHPRDMPGRQFPFLSIPWEQNPYVPNAEKIQEEWGETDFLSPGWFVQWSTVPAHIQWNVNRLGDHVMRRGERAVVDALDAYTSWPISGADDPDPMQYAPMSAW